MSLYPSHLMELQQDLHLMLGLLQLQLVTIRITVGLKISGKHESAQTRHDLTNIIGAFAPIQSHSKCRVYCSVLEPVLQQPITAVLYAPVHRGALHCSTVQHSTLPVHCSTPHCRAGAAAINHIHLVWLGHLVRFCSIPPSGEVDLFKSTGPIGEWLSHRWREEDDCWTSGAAGEGEPPGSDGAHRLFTVNLCIFKNAKSLLQFS